MRKCYFVSIRSGTILILLMLIMSRDILFALGQRGIYILMGYVK